VLLKPAGQPESHHITEKPNRLALLEGLALFISAPFLLFPEPYPLLTLTGLILVGVAWLLPLVLNSRPNLPVTPFNLVILAWGICLIVGILVTSDPVDTFPKSTGLILGLAVWHYMAVFIDKYERFRVALALTLAIAAGFSLIGLAGLDMIIKIPALANINPLNQVANPLPHDLAIHPNQLAGLICLYLPLLASLFFAKPSNKKSNWEKVGLAILFIIALFILLLTQSRGGWIATTAGFYTLLLLWSVVLPPSGTRRVLAGLTISLAVIVAIVFLRIGPSQLAAFWLDPPAETIVGTLETLNYRRELWPWAIQAVSDFPFTGTGLGAFRQVAFRLYPLSLNPNLDIGHAHNIFLQIALDVGLPGLIAYLALILLAGFIGWRVARRNPILRPAALGLLAGLVALHVFGLADALALGSKPGIVFWSMMGLLTGMNRITPGRKITPPVD